VVPTKTHLSLLLDEQDEHEQDEHEQDAAAPRQHLLRQFGPNTLRLVVTGLPERGGKSLDSHIMTIFLFYKIKFFFYIII
jgi:hypothetical protein